MACERMGMRLVCGLVMAICVLGDVRMVVVHASTEEKDAARTVSNGAVDLDLSIGALPSIFWEGRYIKGTYGLPFSRGCWVRGEWL